MVRAAGLIGLLALAGCASEASGPIMLPGQWTHPTAIGEGRFLIQGYGTQAAITGAQQFCAASSSEFVMIQMLPATDATTSKMTFRCAPK